MTLYHLGPILLGFGLALYAFGQRRKGIRVKPPTECSLCGGTGELTNDDDPNDPLWAPCPWCAEREERVAA